MDAILKTFPLAESPAPRQVPQSSTGFGRDIAIERFLSDFKLATPGYSEYNDDFHIY